MRVHSPSRALLVFFVLSALVLSLAVPAVGRAPVKLQTDFREGDPGDGLLSPRTVSSTTTPDTETTTEGTGSIAGGSEAAVGIAPAPLAPTGRFWFAPLPHLSIVWIHFLEGGWHHAR